MKIDIMFLVPSRMGFNCRTKIFHYSSLSSAEALCFVLGFFKVCRRDSRGLGRLFIPYNFPLACLACDYPACKL
jgi:hypothetical protein